MSIDWEKALARPKSTQKVKGKDLLELRERIAELDERLLKKGEHFLRLKEKFEATEKGFKDIIDKASLKERNLKIRISELEEKLELSNKKIKDRNKKLNEILEPREEENLSMTIEKGFIKSSSEITDKIISKLNYLDSKIHNVKMNHINEFKINKAEINQVNDRLDNLLIAVNKALPESTRELERIKEELKIKDEQIRITKNDLNEAIISKDAIITKLESDLEAKINEIEELNNTIEALYTQMADFKNTPKLIKKLVDVLEERNIELDDDLESFLEKQFKGLI